MKPQLLLDLHAEMIVDNFAGGGGASTGIEQALNRCPDIAINHCSKALAMHQANHPQTLHLREDVFKVDPSKATNGRRVGLAWFSPDCTHFSKAKNGKPRSKKVRGLAWVMVKWAAIKRPRVMVLENVEEFQTWGPLLGDGTPCPRRKGRTFKSFVKRLRGLGYEVEWRELRACDFGTPTIRKRLFLIARCDGKPIIWPDRGDWHWSARRLGGKLRRERTAADCIDWSIPCHSIFLTKAQAKRLNLRINRPLAQATMRRIARGMFKFVIHAKEPFFVPLTHQGAFLTEHANASTQRIFSATEPLRTQCAAIKGGHFALVTAFLAKHYGGNYKGPGAQLTGEFPTITTRDHHALVTAHLAKFYGTATGQDVRGPLHSITAGAGGGHHTVVLGFLMKYYSEGGQDSGLREPLHTITTKDRMALVTVDGQDYGIDDIGMRMLKARELFRGQGFPETYQIDAVCNGKRLTESDQIRMCGNSVPPPVVAAIVACNVPEMAIKS